MPARDNRTQAEGSARAGVRDSSAGRRALWIETQTQGDRQSHHSPATSVACLGRPDVISSASFRQRPRPPGLIPNSLSSRERKGTFQTDSPPLPLPPGAEKGFRPSTRASNRRSSRGCCASARYFAIRFPPTSGPKPVQPPRLPSRPGNRASRPKRGRSIPSNPARTGGRLIRFAIRCHRKGGTSMSSSGDLKAASIPRQISSSSRHFAQTSRCARISSYRLSEKSRSR